MLDKNAPHGERARAEATASARRKGRNYERVAACVNEIVVNFL